jgi:hypothetical protein
MLYKSGAEELMTQILGWGPVQLRVIFIFSHPKDKDGKVHRWEIDRKLLMVEGRNRLETWCKLPMLERTSLPLVHMRQKELVLEEA